MSTERKKSRHRKKIRFVLIFTTTLSIVLLLGLAGIFVYQYSLRTNEINTRSDNSAGFLPEGASVAVEAPKAGSVADDNQLTDAVNEADETNAGRYADILGDREYMRENRLYFREPTVSGEAQLLFAGDILFDEHYAAMATARKRGGTADQAFSADLLALMQNADVMMLNNEFTYTNKGEPLPEKLYTFRAHPDTAAWLDNMGVKLVSLANNHTFDYGEVGLLDTLETLEAREIPYVGAGRNIDEAAAPVYFIIGDLKIAIIAATQIERYDNPDTRGATAALPGVFRFFNADKLLETVALAKENSDFVVVFLHWGTENSSEIDWSQMEQGLKIAAAGADLIVGSHPHVLQGITYHGETPVIYSLGNFWFGSRSVDTGILEAIVDENGLKSLRFIPALQENCFTSLLYDGEKDRILDFVRKLSPDVHIDEDGVITR